MNTVSPAPSSRSFGSSDGLIPAAFSASAVLVVSSMLPSEVEVPVGSVPASPVAVCPNCQPTTVAAVAPMPSATKNNRITPATYTKYLTGDESILSRSIIPKNG